MSVEVAWVAPRDFAAPRPVPGRPPPDATLCVIADVHGRLDLLEALQGELTRELRHRRTRRKIIVYLGDYLSRGPWSRETVERIMNWRPPGLGEVEIVPLKGNHEDMALRFLEGNRGLGRNWLASGGLSTLASYGVAGSLEQLERERGVEELRQRFQRALPPSHLEFFRRLKTHHREGSYYLVHAGIRPGVPLRLQREWDHMWIKHEFLGNQADHGATIVHGHFVVPEPQLHPNRIALDTGAHQSGHLTCLVLQGGRRSFLQTAPGKG